MSAPIPAPTGTLLHAGGGEGVCQPWSCPQALAQGGKHHGHAMDCSWTPSTVWGSPVGHKQWSLQPCPGQAPGVPQGHPQSPLPGGEPHPPLREPMPRGAVWSLAFAHQPSSAEGTVPTSTAPAPVAAPLEGIWEAALSLSGACSLMCAHRHPGRMAWRSLVLLPFLLTTGKDSSWHLAWVGGRCWSCF